MIDIAVSSLNSCSHFCGSLVVWTSHYDMVGLWLCKNHDSCSMAQSVFLLVAMGSSHQDPSFSSIAMIAQPLLSMKTMRWGVCTSSMLLSGSESRWLPLVFSVPGGNDGVSTPTCCSSNEVSVCILSSRSHEGSTVLSYYCLLCWVMMREERGEKTTMAWSCDTKINSKVWCW